MARAGGGEVSTAHSDRDIRTILLASSFAVLCCIIFGVHGSCWVMPCYLGHACTRLGGKGAPFRGTAACSRGWMKQEGMQRRMPCARPTHCIGGQGQPAHIGRAGEESSWIGGRDAYLGVRRRGWEGHQATDQCKLHPLTHPVAPLGIRTCICICITGASPSCRHHKILAELHKY